ncbi:uncharacterized protein [Littorina saxatilis]|uniref:uncharacterized protein n=1 Tax=Littorina saxatilis TaxID=31220 RepID=UPI0038B4D0D8
MTVLGTSTSTAFQPAVDGQNDVDEQALDQEALFDDLRLKHQSLCDILKATNKCTRHFVCTGFAGSIPLFCLIIYALTSGSLDLANTLLQVYNVIFTVSYTAFLIFVGIRANDAGDERHVHRPLASNGQDSLTTGDERQIEYVEVIRLGSNNNKVGGSNPQSQQKKPSFDGSLVRKKMPAAEEEVEVEVEVEGDEEGGKERKVSSRRNCTRCKLVTVFTTVQCVVIAVLFVFNAARYTSIYYYKGTSVSGYLISAISFQSFFTGCALLYMVSAYDMATTLPGIMADLWRFERRYGTSVDCAKFYRITRGRCKLFFLLQASFCVGFLVCQHSVFPSLREHLSPFHVYTGVWFYCALLGFTVVFFFLGSYLFALLCFLAVMTAFLSLEFHNVAKQLEAVFQSAARSVQSEPECLTFQTTTTDDIKASMNHPRECELYHRSQDTVGSLSDVPDDVEEDDTKPAAFNSGAQKAACSTKQDCSLRSSSNKEFLPTVESAGDKESCSRTQSEFMSTAASVAKKRKTSSSVLMVRPTASFRDKQVNEPDTELTRRNKSGSKSMSASAVLFQQNEHSDPSKGHTLDRDNAVLETSTSTAFQPAVQGQNDVDEQALDQEALFDDLRLKHQSLCDILQVTNKCLRHFVVMGFAGNVPLFCLIIYALTSGSLDLANTLFQVYNVVFTVAYTTLLILFGIRINDAAHSPQEVIYASDWSNLSDRLLCKVQLFASRLGHVKLGYDVYGLFVIDRSTVLMVVGTLVTYSVVVIQFQQGDVSTCSTGSNSSIVN